LVPLTPSGFIWTAPRGSPDRLGLIADASNRNGVVAGVDWENINNGTKLSEEAASPRRKTVIL
jgi:hypothetical protein